MALRVRRMHPCGGARACRPADSHVQTWHRNAAAGGAIGGSGRPVGGGTGRIRGRVVRADTGASLPGADIRLSGDRTARSATADDAGRYELADVPAGRFFLSAAKGGYVTLQYGGFWSPATPSATDPGRALTLMEGQVLSDVDFALPRGGVITGRITDEFGDPVTGVLVRIERYQHGPGGRRRAAFAFGMALSPLALVTNDLGAFRIFGLMPGEYSGTSSIRLRGGAVAAAAHGRNGRHAVHADGASRSERRVPRERAAPGVVCRGRGRAARAEP